MNHKVILLLLLKENFKYPPYGFSLKRGKFGKSNNFYFDTEIDFRKVCEPLF